LTKPMLIDLSVPNSNPNSAFSHFELRSVRKFLIPGTDVTEIAVVLTEDEATDEQLAVGPIFYTIYGRFNPDKRDDGCARAAQAIADFNFLEGAKQFLVDLNGPLPENHEDL